MQTRTMLNSCGRKVLMVAASALLVFYGGCATQPTTPDASVSKADGNPNRLMVVDCLLPSKVQQLGQKLTYLAPRRAIKTTAVDCEIRGGEYVAYDRSNYATALKIWLPQAQEGDPAAQAYVGEIYEKGLGIQADYALAMRWYRKAAAQGYSRAMINLGYLYESGLGVPVDLTQAMNWYRKASGLTDAELEYVSSVERAQREAAELERRQLRTEVSALQQELDATRNQLVSRKQELSAEKQRAAKLRRALQEQKQAAAQVAPTPPVSVRADTGANTAENQQLSQALKTARNEQQRLTQRIAELQKETQQLAKQGGGAGQQSAALQQALAQQKSLESQLQQTRKTQQELQQRLVTAQLQGAQAKQLQQQLAQSGKTQADLEKRLQSSEQAKQALLTQLEAARNGVGNEAELQQALAQRLKEQSALEQQLQLSRQEQGRLQTRLVAAQKDSAKSSSKIASLEQALKAQEEKVHAKEREIERLEGALKGAQATVNEVQAEKVVETVAVGPSIEIIEPPLALTRSVPTAILQSSSREVDVIGRVSPANELLSFQINGEKQQPDKNGLFQTRQTLSAPKTSVHVVAVDKTGKRSALDFVLVPRGGQAAASDKKPAGSGNTNPADTEVDFGEYYALVIGNQNYQNLTNLKTPENDARTVADILQKKYGFKTQLLLNSTRYEMLSALNSLRAQLTEKDNLLIYYAGHGELDPVNLRGYWLPVDAEPENSANWISNTAITDMINVMSAKHILVVADSCYSGSLTRASIARLQPGMSNTQRTKWYRTMTKAKARAVLTSGGVKPVLDSAGGSHSLFAQAFIDTLNSNEQILEGFQLYRSVQKRMKQVTARLNVEQNPQYAPIKYAGHEAGEFFFLPATRRGAVQLDQPVRLVSR